MVNAYTIMTRAVEYLDIDMMLELAAWLHPFVLMEITGQSPIARFLMLSGAALWFTHQGLDLFIRYTHIVVQACQLLSNVLFWVCVFLFFAPFFYYCWLPVSRALTLIVTAVHEIVRFLAPLVPVVMVVICPVFKLVYYVLAHLVRVVMVVICPVFKLVYYVLAHLVRMAMVVIRPVLKAVCRALAYWMSSGW